MRRTFLPMRGNADGMTFGASQDLERRVKLASLLSDEVVVERGWRSLSHRPGDIVAEGSWEETKRERWLSADERAVAYLANDGTLVLRPTTDSPPRMYPDATGLQLVSFEPMLRALPGGVDWIDTGADDIEVYSRGINNADTDEDKAIFRDLVRRVTGEHGQDARDLVLGSGMGAATTLAPEPTYRARQVLDALGPQPSSGLPVVEFQVPRADLLTWEDIARWRQHRAMSRLREVMSEIEGNAYADSRSFEEFTEETARKLVQRLLPDTSESILTTFGHAVETFATVLGVLFVPLGVALSAVPALAPVVHWWEGNQAWQMVLSGITENVTKRRPVGKP